MNPKQLELDRTEETVLRALFGEDYRNSPQFKLLEAFKPGIVQTCIDKFETLVGPFLNDNGSVNGYMLKQALGAKFPKAKDLVPDSNFMLSDLSVEIIKILKGV